MNDDYSRGPDHYAERARKEGYPARSVYKLMEMDERLGLLRPGMRVLDVGASPGSWSMYALKRVRPSGSVLALDLKPMSLAGPGFRFLQADVRDFGTRELLSAEPGFDLVMSDAAPDTTGSRAVDTGRSATLARAVIEVARALLGRGGSLVVKLFQGGDERDILSEVRSLFDSAKSFRPKATRKSSFEIYCVGIGFRGPKRDD